MSFQRKKLLRAAAIALVTALVICAAATISFAQDKDTAGAGQAQIEDILSKIEKRLAAIEERLQALEKERGPSAYALTPGTLQSKELQKKWLEATPQLDVLKKLYSATPGEKYGGIGAYMSQEDSGPVTITEVMEGKPAAKAGLEPGDAIVSVGGNSVEGKSVAEVAEMIKGEPGSDVTLTIKRDGEDKEITVTRELIGESAMEWFVTPKTEELELELPEMGEDFVGIGITLAENDEGQPIVQDVIDDTPADESGLKAGDVILEVNGEDVETTSDVAELIGGGAEGEKVTLTIQRDGEEKDVTLTRALIKRSAMYEGLEFPNVEVYKEALKGQKEGLKAYEQALKALKDADVYKDVLKAHPEAAEAYEKALKALQEKDFDLQEVPKGWFLYDDDEDEDADEDGDVDKDDDEDADEGDDDDRAEVRKEIKVLTTGDRETTRSLMVKVGPDGEAQVLELEDGEWVENDDDDGTMEFKIMGPDSGEGRCMILGGPQGGEGEKVIRIIKGDGSGAVKAGATCKCGGMCKGECKGKGQSWILGPNPCDAAGPPPVVRRSSAACQCPCCAGACMMNQGSPCGGTCVTMTASPSGQACVMGNAAPCGQTCSMGKACTCGKAQCTCGNQPCGKSCASSGGCACGGTCAGGICGSAGMQFFTSLDGEGDTIVLCRSKGSLVVCDPKGGCCRN